MSVRNNIKHPYSGMATKILENRVPLRELVKKLARESIEKYGTPDKIDLAELRAVCEQNNQLVMEIIQSEPTGIEVKQAPKPPRGGELYNRFDQRSELVDVGSGRGNRLVDIQRSKKFSLTTYDPCEDGPVNKTSGQPISKHHKETFDVPDGRVFSSFNAITQNKDGGALIKCDGLHITPSLDTFANHGIAVYKGGFYTTEANGVTYVDYQIPARAAPLTTFYNGIATYAERNCEVRLTHRTDYTWELDSIGDRLYTDDQVYLYNTKKYDGILTKMVVNDGVCYYTDRDGLALLGKSDLPDCCLYLERVDEDKNYRLLRVSKFRTYVPFHAPPCLKEFCDRIHLKINGMPVFSPELGVSEEGTVLWVRDGSYGFKELLVKYHETVDLRHNDIDKFIELGKTVGKRIKFPNRKKQIFEYRRFRYEADGVEIHRFDPVKARNSYNKVDITTVRKFFQRLEITDLGEINSQFNFRIFV